MDSWFFLSFPRYVDSAIAGPEEAKNLAGKDPPPVSDPFSSVEFGKNHVTLSRQNVKTKGCSHDAVIRVYDDAGNVIQNARARGPETIFLSVLAAVIFNIGWRRRPRNPRRKG
jgi:hypothetical protein